MLNSGEVNALKASHAAGFFSVRPMPSGLVRLQELATLRCGDAQVDVNRLVGRLFAPWALAQWFSRPDRFVAN